MAFTTWTDLHAALLNAYADAVAAGKVTTSSYSVTTGGGTREIKYRTLDELRQAIDQAAAMAAIESGAAAGRTYATNGGRG